jgi:hypothetical protein
MASQERKLVLQTHWQKVLDVHADWLLSKGYSERLLDSAETEGTLITRLKDAIQQAVIHSLWVHQVEQFSIETIGLFAQKEDEVRFQFHYELDPTRLRLHLTSMKATLDEVSIDVLIERNRPADLLPAGLVHRQLETLGKTILLNKVIEHSLQQPLEAITKGKTL